MGKAAILFACLLGLTACGSVQRHPDSGYGEINDDSYGQRSPSSIPEDVGSEQMTLGQRRSFEQRLDLRNLERKLYNDIERKQYYRYKPFFTSNLERIEFLQLRDHRARERWLENHGIKRKGYIHDGFSNKAVDDADVVLGMTKGSVRKSWGPPDIVEVAGNPDFENERWRYTRHVASPEGFKEQHQVIYFDSGRVSGWETH